MTDQRYIRQLIIDGWGEVTQEKLANSKVFILGAGGLGCPTALNLTLAGVGQITVCDYDTVDVTNLNRQFLHAEKDVDKDKAQSAKDSLSEINSEVTIKTISQKITTDVAEDLVGDAELILDCADNFDARFALNQCSIKNNIPMIHGAIWGMEGRLTVFHPPETPCLSCIFPVPPEPHMIPVLGGVSCSTGGLQAIEALKILTGLGTTLKNKMLIADYSTMSFQTLEIGRNPSCPVCVQSS